MNLINLIETIESERKIQGFSQESLAYQSEISPSTYRRMKQGENVGINSVIQVANSLKLEIVAIYQK